MSQTVIHSAFLLTHPTVSTTTTGRVRLRFGDATSIVLDLDDARAMMQDIEGALVRLAYRRGETIDNAVAE